MKEDTINAMFWTSVKKFSSRVALKAKRQGKWIDYTWDEFGEVVKDFGAGLISIGIEPGDKIALLSENRPEWAFSDLAVLSIGAVTVPVYSTDTPAQIEYILNDCQAKVVVVSNLIQLDKIERIKHNVKFLQKIIVIDGPTRFDDPRILNFWVLVEEAGKDGKMQDLFWSAQDQVKPHDIASIIYTSGTTGDPKGVMLTHHNFMSNVKACVGVIPISDQDTYLSFLPLSHVFERTAGQYFMISHGVTIAYAESIYTVAENMKEIAPTIVCGVPRFFEKSYAKIMESAIRSNFFKRNLFFWALKIGGKYSQKKSRAARIRPPLNFQYRLAEKLVFEKIKSQMGGRLRFFISGGAPLAREIIQFFSNMGIVILEGYGLTETSPVISVNALDKLKIGTVGQPLPGVEVRIAQDGEILTKGPHVMKGYLNKEKETQETIKDGWLYTGDIGYLDEDGFLVITDRKKDIIVTAGGKNVAPAKIENLLRSDRFINEVMVYGDRKKYLVALIVPDFDRLKKYAEYKHISFESMADLVKDTKIFDFIQRRINRKLKDLPSFEQLKYFTLLDKEFRQEKGELTPTMKVRRLIVSKEYGSTIEKMYED